MNDSKSAFPLSTKLVQLLIPLLLILVVIALVVGFVLPRMRGGTDLASSMAANATSAVVSTAAQSPPAPTTQAVISSSGEVLADTGGGIGPTSVEAQMPAIPESPAEQPAQPTDWLRYTDQQFGFSITYPNTYVLLDAATASAAAANPVHRVWFQDKTIASGATAALEPPAFAVDVFANPDGLALAQWLDANEPHRDATRTAVTVGDTPGYKVALTSYVAPGQFYYVAAGNAVYRLTPLGQYGEEMLKSFRLGGS
jgi:hypothetical protein